MFKKVFAMTAAVCMTAAMFASCGGNDDSSSSKKAADSAATTEAATTEAATTETATTEAATSEAPADSGAADAGDEYIDEYTGLACAIPDESYEAVKTFEGHDAFLMFADQDWMWSNFNGQGYEGEAAYGVDADITADGEYTVALTVDSIYKSDGALNEQIVLDGDYILPAQGATVFCVDITGICDGTINFKGEEMAKNKLKEGTPEEANVNKKIIGPYTGQEITVHVTSIKCDGEEIPFDESKIIYGNIEDDNNCYRIEIYNEYGNTKDDPGIDRTQIMFAKSLEVTFTIEGL
ncbi:MAG: hypothetical protein IJ737_02995 [Ruminococcus sp.]|nr:hypothetical protein [Ruminococcus sp.]